MKKIRIISLMLVVLMLALALASCGGYQKLNKIYEGEYYDASPAYASAKELAAVAGATFVDVKGDLALFSKLDGTTITYTVMNVKTEAVVGTYTDTDTVDTVVSLYSALHTAFYKVLIIDNTNTEKTYTTKLYTASGAEFAASTKENVCFDIELDFVQLDEKVYRSNEEGSFAEAFDRPAYAGDLPSVQHTDGKYYYSLSSGIVYSYDDEFNLLAVIKTPGYATTFSSFSSQIFLLGDGNIMLEYFVSLPKDAQDFDVRVGDAKYDLKVVIASAKDGSQKEIDSDYYFDEIESYKIYNAHNRPADAKETDYKIDVYAKAYEIVDQQLVRENEKHLALSTSGKVKGALDENIDGQNGEAVRLNADYFVINTKDGKKKLVDMSGDVIADVSSARYLLENMIVCEDAIYDYSLNKVLDLKEEEMTLFGTEYVPGGSVVLLMDKDDKIYLYMGPTDSNSSAAPQLIADNDKTKVYYYSGGFGFYVVDTTNANATYTYYNNAGVALFTVNESLDYVGSGDDCFIYEAEDKFYVIK